MVLTTGGGKGKAKRKERKKKVPLPTFDMGKKKTTNYTIPLPGKRKHLKLGGKGGGP